MLLTSFLIAVGPWQIILIAAVILILFGGGGKRISDFMGGFGKGIKEFKKGLKDENESEDDSTSSK